MLLTREELDETAQIHPQVAAVLAKNPLPKVDNSTHHASREGMAKNTAAMTETLGPAPPTLAEFYHPITLRDGHIAHAKIQKPAPTTGAPPGPLIVLAFGGGFIAGDKDQLTLYGRVLVALFGATVVLIDYRLAPEFPFPYAQHDSWDTLVWAATNATGEILHSDPTKGFIIGGISAGGAIAGALSRKFQTDRAEEGETETTTPRLAYPLTGQWLCIPSLMDLASCPEQYKSVYIAPEQNSDTPSLNKESRDMMTRCTRWDVTSDLRFAARSKNPLRGQPRTYFQVDGMDPLRDDALVYDEMLTQEGVPTKLDLYPGCPHGHWVYMRGVEIGDRTMIDTFVGFGWLLEKEVARTTVAEILGMKAV